MVVATDSRAARPTPAWSPPWPRGAPPRERLILELRTSGGSLEDAYLELVGAPAAGPGAREVADEPPGTARRGDRSPDRDGAAADRASRRERPGHDRHPRRRPALLRLGRDPADGEWPAGRLPAARGPGAGDHRDQPRQPRHRDRLRAQLRGPQAARRLAADARRSALGQDAGRPGRRDRSGRAAGRDRGRGARLAAGSRRVARRCSSSRSCWARSRSRGSAC